MNVFRSLDDELDGNGKAGSHWWIIPFMVTVCFLWGVLGFLSGGTDRKTPTRTDAIAAGLEKTRVSGVAFALALRSAQARNSEFQWVLLQSQSNIPPESNYFCTRG